MFNNLKSFFNILPPAFGLDISDSSLKFVQFNTKGNYFKLQTYGERDLKPGIVEDGSIKKPKQLAGVLREALSQEKLPRHVVVSLPGEAVFLSLLQVPPVGEEELGSAIQVEAEAHIPINLQNAYWDYHVLPFNSQGVHHVLVTAARRRSIDVYLNVLQDAGLNVLAVEPESASIARAAIKGEFSKRPVLIVEIGANRTRLIVFVADSVVFVGSAPYSTMLGATALAQKLKIDVSDAHQLQWERGLSGEGEHGVQVKEILTPFLDSFVQQINKYILFFDGRRVREKLPFDSIGSVVLSGGGSRTALIDEYLSAALDLPVARVNPWVNILEHASKQKAPLRHEQSLRYVAALGLGLRAAGSDVEEIFE